MKKTDEQRIAEEQELRKLLAGGIAQQLLAIPGVFHVSCGMKETKGDFIDQLCIRVYVHEKKDAAELSPAEMIPPVIQGYPTDVNVVGKFEFQADNARYRPVIGGIQISNRIININAAQTATQISRGTFGCVVFANEDSAPMLLSNWHVLSANGGRNGDRIYQPSPTSVPTVSLLELPKRPDENDNADVIAKIRRTVVSNKVDGGIAALDVSSCCGCCGIHYSNAINGLSTGNPARPPRNTIVDKQVAAFGMVVFKVGQNTGRQEGRVVDATFPSITIPRDGNNYTFSGQIAIAHVNTALPFSHEGDSGSVIINDSNKIVGLLFASSTVSQVINGTTYPFITVANHIDDVLSELNIKFKFSPNVIVTSGAALVNGEEIMEAPVHPAYAAWRSRMEGNSSTAQLLQLAEKHRTEILQLVNHCRPVTLAWQRNKGPALLASMMSAIRNGSAEIPGSVRSVSPAGLLRAMQEVLLENGSAALRHDIAAFGNDLIGTLEASSGWDDFFARISQQPFIPAT